MDELIKRIDDLEERIKKLESRIYKDPFEMLLDDFTAGMFTSDDVGETDFDDTY